MTTLHVSCLFIIIPDYSSGFLLVPHYSSWFLSTLDCSSLLHYKGIHLRHKHWYITMRGIWLWPTNGLCLIHVQFSIWIAAVGECTLRPLRYAFTTSLNCPLESYSAMETRDFTSLCDTWLGLRVDLYNRCNWLGIHALMEFDWSRSCLSCAAEFAMQATTEIRLKDGKELG